jgi:type I restriction enzyme, R subunit
MSQEPEWKTRKTRIDRKLRAIGWTIVRHAEGLAVATLTSHAVEEFPVENGFADYAFFVNGQLLGFLEAKKVSVGTQNVLEQAKRYSRTAFSGVGDWRGYRVPFLYSSNGELIYFVDVREEFNLSRQIAGFHTPEALREMFARHQAGYTWLQSHPSHEIGGIRPYQKAAIAATEAAIIQGKRALLVAMATGTGKTFTTVAQVYRLLKSQTVKRVLFLVDRRALAAQAVRAFASFNTPQGNKFTQEYEVYSQKFRREDFGEDEAFDTSVLPNAYLTAPNETHTFVYVCTIQRMKINLFGQDTADGGDGDREDESDAEQLSMPIHAFDLIVADECHRGYTAKDTSAWRDTLEYFDAIKIGLTATPAPHSLSLFKEVVYRYTTEQAIMDGFLVDYEAIAIDSEVKINGAFLQEGESVGVIDPETGLETYDQLEDERDFASTEIERKITVPDTNRKIIQEIAHYALAHEQETGRFPKILIFAVNDLPNKMSHADRVVEICKQEFGRGDDFVQKITGSPSVDRPLQKIREFRNRPNPKVVVSVDMLTTGVDIPKIEFIVFLRPAKSRILWVQMLGRGTRCCDEIHKTHFKVFDCFGGSLIEYFQDTNDFKIDPPRKDPVPFPQVIQNVYNNVDRAYNLKLVVKRLQRVEHGMSGEGREQFAAYIPDGDVGRFASELPERLKQDFTGTMNLLRDAGFQDLVQNYPKPPKTFLVGYDVQDRVTSRAVERGGQYGQSPIDYLDAFAQFIQENAAQIEAIQILTARPQAWNTETLTQLRQALARHQFPEPALQQAHEQVHHKLADIISMVKRAIAPETPLFTAEERVNRALEQVSTGKAFTEDQLKWLGYIREHLIQNLSIEVEDFEDAPIFNRYGGKGKANKVFQGQLGPLIAEINGAIAA